MIYIVYVLVIGMSYILTDVKVENHRSGQKTNFYLYDGTGIKPLTMEVPHIYCSRRLSEEVADRVIENIESDEELKKYKGERIGENKVVIQLYGDRGLFEKIQKISGGVFNKLSVEQAIKYRYPILSKGRIVDGNFVVDEMASLEDLVHAGEITFDIEMRKNESDQYNQIFSESIISKKGVHGNFVETIDYICLEKYDPGSIKIEIHSNTPTATQSRITTGNDQELFGIKTMELLKESGIPIVWGQNIMNYDLLRLREFSELEDAKIKSHNKFSKEVSLTGYQIPDLYRLAQMWLPLPRNNLETISQAFGIAFVKGRSYEELQTSTDNPTLEGNIENAIYNINDSQAVLNVSNKLKYPAYDIALTFKEALSKVSTQRSGLAKKYRDRLYFEKFGTSRFDRSKELDEFDFANEQIKIYEQYGLKTQTRRGIYSNVAILKPILAARKLRLPKEEGIEKLAKSAGNNVDHPLVRLMYSKAVDAWCEEPLLDLLKVRKKELSPQLYGLIYGETPNAIELKLKKEVEETNSLIDELGLNLINYSGDFMAFELTKENKIPSTLLYFGTADKLISASSGRMVFKIDNTVFTPGVDLTGRHGLRTEFERRVISDFAYNLLDKGEWPAIVYLNKEIIRLRTGEIPKEELCYKVKRTKDVYSYPAHKTRRMKMIKELELETGEEGVFIYDSNDDYMEIFFGPETKSGSRRFSEGTISDFVLSIKDNENFGKEILADVLSGKSPRLENFCSEINVTNTKKPGKIEGKNKPGGRQSFLNDPMYV